MSQERLKGIVVLINPNTDRGLIRDIEQPDHAFSLSTAPAGIKVGWTVSFVSRPSPGYVNRWADDVRFLPRPEPSQKHDRATDVQVLPPAA